MQEMECVLFLMLCNISYCHCVKQHQAFGGEAETGKGRERVRRWDANV